MLKEGGTESVSKYSATNIPSSKSIGDYYCAMIIKHATFIPTAVCHEIVDDDISELMEIIHSHGSAKLWCFYLGISDSKCNGWDYSPQHHDDVVHDLAKAYMDETLMPCWESIVEILCKHLKKNKPAIKLSEKHNVDFSSMCM